MDALKAPLTSSLKGALGTTSSSSSLLLPRSVASLLETTPSNCVCVQNLPHDATERGVLRFFSEEIGDCVDAILPVDERSGKHKGFAVVEFTDRALAESCQRNLHGREYDDKKLRIRILDAVEFGADGRPSGADTASAFEDFGREDSSSVLKVTVGECF